MSILTNLHLKNNIYKILKANHHKKQINHKDKLILFDCQNQKELFKEYFSRVQTYTSLKEISWHEIITRRFRVISVPRKNLCTSNSDIWKRRFIRWMQLSVKLELMSYIIHNILLCDHGQKVLIALGHHVAEIYKTHLSNFKVIEWPEGVNLLDVKNILDNYNQLLLHYCDDSSGIIVFSNPCVPELLQLYHRLHPNKKIIVRFHDRITHGVHPQLTSKQICYFINNLLSDNTIHSVESYYKDDAMLLNGLYRPNGANPTFMNKIKTNFKSYLYSFAGTSSKSSHTPRLQHIHTLQNELRKHYPNILEWTSEQIIETDSKKWQPYQTFAQQSALSEVCLDFYRLGPNEGFSYRIIEALFLNQKIITNRTNLIEEPFYSPERVFVIGKDNINNLKRFLESDILPLPDSILKYYNSQLWWTDEDPLNN